MAGGAHQDVGIIRSLTNHVQVAQALRWSWKMFHRQPILVTATALAVSGVAMVAIAGSEDGIVNRNDNGERKHVIPQGYSKF